MFKLFFLIFKLIFIKVDFWRN